MNQSENLKRQTIGPAHEYRNRFRARYSYQPRGRAVPRRIANRARAEIEMRDFSGRKDNQRSTVPYVRQRLPQRAPVGKAGLEPIERIDEDTHRREFRQFTEKTIGEHAGVRADARKQMDQYHAVEKPERVIRDRYDRTCRGNL